MKPIVETTFNYGGTKVTFKTIELANYSSVITIGINGNYMHSTVVPECFYHLHNGRQLIDQQSQYWINEAKMIVKKSMIPRIMAKIFALDEIQTIEAYLRFKTRVYDKCNILLYHFVQMTKKVINHH